jgi:hypothetical protein
MYRTSTYFAGRTTGFNSVGGSHADLIRLSDSLPSPIAAAAVTAGVAPAATAPTTSTFTVVSGFRNGEPVYWGRNQIGSSAHRYSRPGIKIANRSTFFTSSSVASAGSDLVANALRGPRVSRVDLMRGDANHRTRHRGGTSIGALTRRDRYREATLNGKIDDAYGSMNFTSSRRRRRRAIRVARRHERALAAQRRRPQSVLFALGVALAAVLVVLVAGGASSTLIIVAAVLLFADWSVLRRRRRLMRRS